MPSRSQRYPDNWKNIAFAVKEEVGWRCQKCGWQCIKPGDDTSGLTKAERTARTLTVHHANRIPEDNRRSNLIPLCTGCHLSYHYLGQSNVSPGQLSLFEVSRIETTSSLSQNKG